LCARVRPKSLHDIALHGLPAQEIRFLPRLFRTAFSSPIKLEANLEEGNDEAWKLEDVEMLFEERPKRRWLNTP
jgi:hypothetical protein